MLATMSVGSLLKNLNDLTPNDRSLIERAYIKAEHAHEGQFRKSGEPYFTHCMAVAQILADMKLDAEAIAAGLMHDVVEDTAVTLDELRSEFGMTVAMLVESVTKLDKLPLNMDKEQNGRRTSTINREQEYMRKMFLMMNNDIRVVLIKLADRLHNMRTLGYMRADRQQKIAQETLEIFAPLANRLGIWQIKWELEDLSFRYLYPDDYKMLAQKIAERRADRESYVSKIADALRAELHKYNIEHAAISARPKHIYSIFRKMQRKQLPFEQIYDVRAVRVIVDTLPECYLVLMIVHNLWRPIPGEFDDYIAAPKDNFYKSLHTTVLDDQGKTVEVQIRTWEMHEHAEYGIAAHWRYKEGSKGNDQAFEDRIAYLRRLMEFGNDVDGDADAFMEGMLEEVFQDRVYVFTPKGDIVDLPAGATPIDFAYHIHTDIGNRCRGAKVNGRLVNLSHTLQMGDQIEILTTKRGGPSMDWLNPDLGFARTSRARAKIRHWFRKQNRDKHISYGRETLEREMKRLGLDHMTFEAVASLSGYQKLDDFLAAIGAGDITGAQIANKVELERRTQEDEEVQLLKPKVKIGVAGERASGITILGTGGLLVNIAKCCGPMPGDEIVGFVTRGRGVTVHRRDCPNVISTTTPERLIDVSWGANSQEQRYRVPIEVIAYDRAGLLGDIGLVFSNEKVNIASVEVSVRDEIATFLMTVEIPDIHKLTRLLSKIENIPNVVEARRRNFA